VQLPASTEGVPLFAIYHRPTPLREVVTLFTGAGGGAKAAWGSFEPVWSGLWADQMRWEVRMRHKAQGMRDEDEGQRS